MLNMIRHGEPVAGTPPLLIAHGLFGSARNWGVIAKRLTDTRQVIAVDMRNHGASPWADRHGYEDLVDDLAAVIVSLGGQADVAGHSMGGKAAMALALTRPSLVRRLAVLDIAPVAYTHTQAPVVEALRAVDLAAVASRRDADAALAATIDDPMLRAFLLQSLDIADGPRWRLNIDALATSMPAIMGFPDLGPPFAGPALFLTGASSDYVRTEHEPRIRSLFPSMRFEAIAGAAHWLHADKPRETEAALRGFLDTGR